MLKARLTGINQLCNDCFIWMLFYRVTSVFLADSDHSDYLINQLQDIENVCSTQLPEVTIRNLPPYSSTTAQAITTISSPPTSTTCAGQTMSTSSSSCNSLSTKYGVATGDLQTLTGNTTCYFSTAVCLPAACTLQLVSSSQTCDSISTSLNVTTVQFLSWNRNIIGLCDSLTAGQYICARQVLSCLPFHLNSYHPCPTMCTISTKITLPPNYKPIFVTNTQQRTRHKHNICAATATTGNRR